MPKDLRKRAFAHSSSARIANRQFAVQDNAVEHVGVGGAENASATDILQAMASEEAQPHLKKKEKQQLKRELFLQRLESAQAPYSKSHAKRLKRKEKQQIGGGLREMEAALDLVDKDIPAVIQVATQETGKEGDSVPKPKPKSGPRGLIGEGKSTPLTQNQRKQALQTERLRMPIVRKDPNFAANPFAAIRTHAQNTLIKHQSAA